MKKLPIRTFCLLLLTTFICGSLFAQIDEGQTDDRKAKANARTFINQSSIVVREAGKEFRKNKISCSGNLSKACDHQHYALKMFKSGNYGKSLYHSWKARKLAFVCLKSNKATIKDEWLVRPQTVCPPLDEKKIKKLLKNKKNADMGNIENELDINVENNLPDEQADLTFETLK